MSGFRVARCIECQSDDRSSHSKSKNSRPHAADRLALYRLILGKLAVCLVVLAFTTVPGCGGCSSDETADKDQTKKDAGKADKDKKKDKDKQKADEKKKNPPPPYEFVKPKFNVQPSDNSISRRAVKPGHWVTATHHIRANARNFYGELESQTLDRRQKLLTIENTAYDMLISRPVALPKGEVKPIDATYFVPRQPDMEGQQILFHFPFKNRSGSRLHFKDGVTELAIRMPAYQFFFVVLSKNPDRYVFLKSIASVRAPAVQFALDHLHYYRVVLPKFQSGKAPLPSNALNWTAVAYLLWDNLDPTKLRRDQQTALLDWLHWGGQIIVSGPASLDALRGSFLDEHLPATNAKALELTSAHFRDLNDKWSLDVDRKTKLETQLTVPADKPLLGIKLAIRPGAAYLPGTGELVVECRVGRGRIVVTAFPLADRSVVRWRNFDGFFNGCLLRRPKRKFDNNEMLSVTWERHPGLALDPLLASTVRYFSRDMRPMVDPQNEGPTATSNEGYGLEYPPGIDRQPGYARWQDKSVLESPHIAHRDQNTDDDDWHFGGFWFWTDSGVGGWNDKSGVANVARQTLKEAAGIVPPSRGDVLMMLSVYLIVLVPVNWFLFRLIGRVEWAWLMMPVIAIVGAVVVVWRAQLDIGFVRSRTEVAVLEVHGGYPRGHLSRYTALYSSLSTSFDFTFES
ncbi:MAG: hypothetical protein IH991_08140, partial [Planctomycetes bacterium]|nr:hypothetical protein [Planctomycetota bacterium]